MNEQVKKREDQVVSQRYWLVRPDVVYAVTTSCVRYYRIYKDSRPVELPPWEKLYAVTLP